MTERRAILEDALSEALRRIGEIDHNDQKDRCLSIQIGPDPQIWELHPLYPIACDLERALA